MTIHARDLVQDPEFSDLTRGIVSVGNVLEASGFELVDEAYANGEQDLFYVRGPLAVDVTVRLADLDDEDEEEDDDA